MIENVLTKSGEFADLAFIDGDHRITGCMKDFVAVDKFLRPGGIIILHDTQIVKDWLGPIYLLQQLGEKQRDRYGIINIRTADSCGMALLQKHTPEQTQPCWPSVSELVLEQKALKFQGHRRSFLGLIRAFLRK
jgi:hypothetical protein